MTFLVKSASSVLSRFAFVERLALDHVPARIEHQRENKLRRHDPLLLRALQVRDHLIGLLGDAVQPRDVGFRIRHGIDPVDIDEKRRRLRVPAEHLVHRIIVETEAESLGVLLHVVLKQLPAQLRLRIERVEIEIAFQPARFCIGKRQILRVRRIGEIVPFVVIGLEPERRRDLRMARDKVVEILVEKFIRPLRFRGDLLRRVGLRRAPRPGKLLPSATGAAAIAIRILLFIR